MIHLRVINTVLFLLCTSVCYAQIDKAYGPDFWGIGGGESLVLKKDGTYKHTESTCLDRVSGTGRYSLRGDTLLILNYKPGREPFEITLSSGKNKDSLYFELESDFLGVIISISTDNNIGLYQQSRKSPSFAMKTLPKSSIKAVIISFMTADHRDTLVRRIPIGSKNIVKVYSDTFVGYFRPYSLYDKWLIRGDTLYKGNSKSFLVDTALSKGLFDEY